MPLELNPELLLKAAQVAFPKYEWKFDSRSVVTWDATKKCGMAILPTYFNPLTSDADAMKLERALKQRGNGWWSFFVNALGLYMASSAEGPCESQYDESDTLLLLRCISAQFSIPLYLENT